MENKDKTQGIIFREETAIVKIALSAQKFLKATLLHLILDGISSKNKFPCTILQYRQLLFSFHKQTDHSTRVQRTWSVCTYCWTTGSKINSQINASYLHVRQIKQHLDLPLGYLHCTLT